MTTASLNRAAVLLHRALDCSGLMHLHLMQQAAGMFRAAGRTDMAQRCERAIRCGNDEDAARLYRELCEMGEGVVL